MDTIRINLADSADAKKFSENQVIHSREFKKANKWIEDQIDELVIKNHLASNWVENRKHVDQR
jgi:hypothetical protein